MSLKINNTKIPVNGDYVIYNGTKLTSIKYNGVIVWKKVSFTTKEYGATGGMQSCLVYGPALYRLEVWGSRGGPDLTGAYGGYACRYYAFDSDTTIYICCGTASGSFPFTYNGGGYENYNNKNHGGGATHIATTNRGELRNYSSYRSEVLVVAGGGGGDSFGNGAYGGTGGGLTGGSGEPGISDPPTGGTQTGPGYSPDMTYMPDYPKYAAGFGYGAYGHATGGGGGWYGGGNSHKWLNYKNAGAGGSGYIGVSSITYDGVTYTNSMSNGARGSTGYARITFIA